MIYTNIKQGRFLARPNRFIAHVEIQGEFHVAHVKNTGRCRELLLPGSTIFLQEFDSPTRKTKFDLISVYKEDKLINMDSQVPNKVFSEWIRAGNLFEGVRLIKPETTYGNSRLDFYVETEHKKILVEVKGVTLEENGVAMFPDAPTERGIKHVKELEESLKFGYEAYVVFIIQMKDILYFTPNAVMHKAFADAVKQAAKTGVKVLALDCEVTENSILPGNLIDVKL